MERSLSLLSAAAAQPRDNFGNFGTDLRQSKHGKLRAATWAGYLSWGRGRRPGVALPVVPKRAVPRQPRSRQASAGSPPGSPWNAHGTPTERLYGTPIERPRDAPGTDPERPRNATGKGGLPPDLAG